MVLLGIAISALLDAVPSPPIDYPSAGRAFTVSATVASQPLNATPDAQLPCCTIVVHGTRLTSAAPSPPIDSPPAGHTVTLSFAVVNHSLRSPLIEFRWFSGRGRSEHLPIERISESDFGLRKFEFQGSSPGYEIRVVPIELAVKTSVLIGVETFSTDDSTGRIYLYGDNGIRHSDSPDYTLKRESQTSEVETLRLTASNDNNVGRVTILLDSSPVIDAPESDARLPRKHLIADVFATSDQSGRRNQHMNYGIRIEFIYEIADGMNDASGIGLDRRESDSEYMMTNTLKYKVTGKENAINESSRYQESQGLVAPRTPPSGAQLISWRAGTENRRTIPTQRGNCAQTRQVIAFVDSKTKQARFFKKPRIFSGISSFSSAKA